MISRMKSTAKIKPKRSSTFSEFIRNVSSKEKKRVYTRVIKKSTEMQKMILNDDTTD